MSVRRAWCAVALLLVTMTTVPGLAGAGAAPTRCNGSVASCDRSLGAVAFATTHNSMASTANHFRPPNQLRHQLDQPEDRDQTDDREEQEPLHPW